jgi:hypothetical protein
VRLNAELDENKGPLIQSVSTKLATAVALSPCCQAVTAGWLMGAAADGLDPDEDDCLPHPAIESATAKAALMVVFLIKGDTA